MNFFQKYLSYAKAARGIMHGSKAFGGPLHVVINLTNRCNTRCIHCHYYSDKVTMPHYNFVINAKHKNEKIPDIKDIRQFQSMDMDSDILHNYLKELLKMGTRRFSFSGGEPFLHKDIFKSVKTVKAKKSWCIIHSNGLMLSKDNIKKLILLKLDSMRITTMAGTPEIYMKTHPGIKEKKFETLKKNLIYLADRKSALNINTPQLTLVMVVIDRNVEDLLNFAEFAVEVGADNVEYIHLRYKYNSDLFDIAPTKDHFPMIKNELLKAKRLLNSKGLSNNIDIFLNQLLNKHNITDIYKKISCYVGWLYVYVQANGTVYPCCHSYVPLGDINKTSMEQIWNNTAYQKFRKHALAINLNKGFVDGCNCAECQNYLANMRVHRILHPLNRFI